jgi:uncharacterized protein
MTQRAAESDASVAALVRVVRGTAWLCRVLEVVRKSAPAGAYVAAGAVRDTVWNFLTGRPSLAPVADVDVVYWSDGESEDAAREHEARLRALAPEFDWEVTNQATVHLWHWRTQGSLRVPHGTVADGLASWPETATAVGIRLALDGDIQVLAPLGLDDLFALRLRHNAARTAVEVFWQRVEAKQWAQRWPELQIIAATKG